MTLSDLTVNQLWRIYNRIYSKYADCYGIDSCTLQSFSPQADEALREIWLAINKSNYNAKI